MASRGAPNMERESKLTGGVLSGRISNVYNPLVRWPVAVLPT